MRKLSLTASMALALLFMATPNLHAATGTYIDCIHGCPDLIVCTSCCNETFRSILGACDAKRDQCEALCPPGAMDCLNICMRDRNDCLGQGSRDFDCPHWKTGGPQPGLTKTSECRFCHEDDR
ncbi:hypothetical protein SAMN05660653_01340 [Desulfonatronum thiosulfatophilum]|uniref:Uncharacterized protein n=1 Tax=Desulfonatronum thiosulfatophilum TaxID=617002 RepID=A0A1G6C605_9BACT|nr:hypothetical protein [Desulfonatronum thiosulfatophilum]SDB28310.1 hypothetical protein SAMN05660653_01340 [Desulfonatronum thiosulfatophilum]